MQRPQISFPLEYDAQSIKDLSQAFHHPLPPFPNGCVSLNEGSISFFACLPDWIGTVFPVKWKHLRNLVCVHSFACSVVGGHVRWASSSMSKLDLCNPWGSGCEEQGCVRCCGSTWCSGPGACSWHSWNHQIKLALLTTFLYWHHVSIHLYTWFIMCSSEGMSLWRFGSGWFSVMLSKK